MEANTSSPNPADRVLVLKLINPDSSCGFQFGACDPDFNLVAWIDDGHGSLTLHVNEEDKSWLRVDYVPLDVEVDVDVFRIRDTLRSALWGDAYVGLNSADDQHLNVATVASGQHDHYVALEFRRDADGRWRRLAADGSVLHDAAAVQNKALEEVRSAIIVMRGAADECT